MFIINQASPYNELIETSVLRHQLSELDAKRWKLSNHEVVGYTEKWDTSTCLGELNHFCSGYNTLATMLVFCFAIRPAEGNCQDTLVRESFCLLNFDDLDKLAMPPSVP